MKRVLFTMGTICTLLSHAHAIPQCPSEDTVSLMYNKKFIAHLVASGSNPNPKKMSVASSDTNLNLPTEITLTSQTYSGGLLTCVYSTNIGTAITFSYVHNH